MIAEISLDGHVYDSDIISTRIQHKYSDVIIASRHLHLEDNCLESVLVIGKVKRIKELAK